MKTLRLLCVLTLVASASVFVLPATREAACEPARLVLGFDPPEIHLPPLADDQPTRKSLDDRLFARYANVARGHRDDIGVQMGFAIADWPFADREQERDEGIVRNLRLLLREHNASPDLYACLLFFNAKWVTSTGQPEFDLWADAGERLEPDNAFFPAMRAVGLARAGRSRNAIVAIERAAAKPNWDDHYATLLDGRIRLDAAVLGRRDIARYLAYSTFRPTQWNIAKDLSESVSVEAHTQEKAEHRASALNLQLDAIRLGNVWRNQSRTLDGNSAGDVLMGRTLTDMAKSEGYRHNRALSLDANRARARAAVHAYAKRAGRPDAIAKLDRAAELRDATNKICRAAWKSEISGVDPLMYLILGRRLAMILLSAALWVALIGGGMAWVHHARDDRETRTRRVLAAWCGGIAFCAWQAHGLMGLGFWVESAGERDPAWLLGANATAMGLSIAMMSRFPAEIAHLLRVRRWKREHPQATKDERRGWESADHSKSLRRASLPAVAVLMALFAWLIIGTSRIDKKMTGDLRAQTTHEGRYYAHLLGKTWPE